MKELHGADPTLFESSASLKEPTSIPFHEHEHGSMEACVLLEVFFIQIWKFSAICSGGQITVQQSFSKPIVFHRTFDLP